MSLICALTVHQCPFVVPWLSLQVSTHPLYAYVALQFDYTIRFLIEGNSNKLTIVIVVTVPLGPLIEWNLAKELALYCEVEFGRPSALWAMTSASLSHVIENDR